MKDKRKLWNQNQKNLKEIILNTMKFDEAINLFLMQHAMVHSSGTSEVSDMTLEDSLWHSLDYLKAKTVVGVKNRTIAYGIWHSTRIEDITMNILIADEDQVLSTNNWKEKINCPISDTGNSLDAKGILDLTMNANIDALRDYRIEVAKKTRLIVEQLKPIDLKRKMQPNRLKRIITEKAVLDTKESSWLIDFWSRKNVAGILLMPVTRHHMVHINECLIAKRKVK
jgi:hypothetical protein